MIEILNRWTQVVVYRSEAPHRAAAVVSAVQSGADLREADLAEANLGGADLAGADLAGANLAEANLAEANLAGANLLPIRDDFWAVLAAVPAEIPALRAALIEGRVNGSSYEGDCACLVGTVANARHCAYDQIPELRPNAGRPAERFFLAIGIGDTLETSQFSKLAVEWLDQFTTRMKAAFGGTA